MTAAELAAEVTRLEAACQGTPAHMPVWEWAEEKRSLLLFRARCGDAVARAAILDLLDRPHPSPERR